MIKRLLEKGTLVANKVILTTVISVVLLTATVTSASGWCIQNVVVQHKFLSSTTAYSSFMSGYYGTGAWGTDTTRVVRQCYVQLVINGTDTGRLYSVYDTSNSGRDVFSPTASVHNPFNNVGWLSYGWYY